MNNIINLSRKVDERLKVYPSNPLPVFRQTRSLKTDTCNTWTVSMTNHTSTHIDAPAHFIPTGKRIAEYTSNELSFKKVMVLGKKDLKMFIDNDLLDPQIECVIFRDIEIEPHMVLWFRNFYRNLKCLGTNRLSFSNPRKRAEGRENHICAFKPMKKASQPLLLVEHLDLSRLGKREIRELWLIPWLGGQLDSSPCTVIARV
jgi:kynurenine formamidase